jgi:hypothetical protein
MLRRIVYIAYLALHPQHKRLNRLFGGMCYNQVSQQEPSLIAS